MSITDKINTRSRAVRTSLALLLVAVLAVGVFLVWPTRTGSKIRRPLHHRGRVVPR